MPAQAPAQLNFVPVGPPPRPLCFVPIPPRDLPASPTAALPHTMPSAMFDLGLRHHANQLPESPSYIKLPPISPFMIDNNIQPWLSAARLGTVDASML